MKSYIYYIYIYIYIYIYDGTFGKANFINIAIDKLADTYKSLFNEDPPKGYKTPLHKEDHPE